MVQEQKRKGLVSDPFVFISDHRLKADILDALDFSAYLTVTLSGAREGLFKRELRRTNVLYIASVIEAVCLFLLEKKKVLVEKVEYKYVCPLKTPPEVSISSGILVFALQVRGTFPFQNTAFAQAIQTLKAKKIIAVSLAEDLDYIREARNTQHLYRRSSKHISQGDVESALATLKKILDQIPASIKT